MRKVRWPYAPPTRGAEYFRRLRVSAESPTLRLPPLQFGAADGNPPSH